MNFSRIIETIREGIFWEQVSYHIMHVWRWFKPISYFHKIQNKKIVCSSYNGMFHADSPALIADKLLEKDPTLDIVWLVDKRTNYTEYKGIRTVYMFSSAALYELSTAHIWIDNMRKSLTVPKKRGQFYLQTWHGGIPLKMIEADAADTLEENYLNIAKNDASNTDLMLSGCRFFTGLCKTAFWYNGEVLEYGIPRDDALFHRDPEKATALKTQLGISDDKCVILYAPTFRDNYSMGSYLSDYSGIGAAFCKVSGKQPLFLVKYHPNIRGSYDFSGEENIIDMTDWSDIQELYMVSDYLITDYSSTMFEFAMLKKPVFLYMNDYEDYLKERKMYFSLESLPFSISFTFEELVDAIMDSVNRDYSDAIEKFFNHIGLCETGHSTEIAADYLFSIINGGI